nr:CobD/CbiB family cobalamin biosynthesis protein [Nocardioides thalensis]
MAAVALDAGFAEPPVGAHPVVWTGRYLDLVAQRVPAAPPGRALATGGLAWLGGASVAVATAVVVERCAARRGRVAGAMLRGVALWPLISGRMLLAEVRAVGAAVDRDPAAGREALGRIVSRDTDGLTPEEVRGAALGSLAENLSDSLVAPLAWYAVGGLPAAALYRFANTADACWGYRSPRWEHAGRVAARADDLLNLVPARLTAALLVGPSRWRRLRREARRTSSPNAGWPMAALALRLDVRLTKRGHYALNADARDPRPGDVAAGLRAARRAATAAAVVAIAADVLTRPPRQGAS